MARELQQGGASLERIWVVGWGKSVVRRALSSDHAHAESARTGCGWGEVFLWLPSTGFRLGQAELPTRPDFYSGRPWRRGVQASDLAMRFGDDGFDGSVSSEVPSESDSSDLDLWEQHGLSEDDERDGAVEDVELLERLLDHA